MCMPLLRNPSVRGAKWLAHGQQLEVAEPRLKRVFAKLSTSVQPHPHIPQGSECLFLLEASLSVQVPLFLAPPPRWCSISHLLSIFSIFHAPLTISSCPRIILSIFMSLSLSGSLDIWQALTSPQMVCLLEKDPKPSLHFLPSHLLLD